MTARSPTLERPPRGGGRGGVAKGLAVVLAAVAVWGAALADEAESGAMLAGQSVGSGSLAPTPEVGPDVPRPDVSAQQHRDLYERLLKAREDMAAKAGGGRAGPGARGGAAPPETGVGRAVLGVGPVQAPETFRIGRNRKNTVAEGPDGSTLAEPAAVNRRKKVFAAGNFDHAEFSTNAGSSWTPIGLPAGLADAPIICCDHDVVMERGSLVAFHSVLYINNTVDNGAVRIFVRPNLSAAGEACSYIIDPAGAADNILPDYPHIALSKGFLYLTINAINFASGTGFARIYRFDVAAMRQCQTAPFTFFDQSFAVFGQRVWVPAEGQYTRTSMFWVQHDNASTLRIFRWNEAAAGPTQATRTVQASNFSSPDCRGGVGNFNWTGGATSASITGFRHRVAVAQGVNQPSAVLAVYWNSAPVGGIPQGHVRAAVFTVSGLNLVNEPHVFNTDFCFGYPAVTSNSAGDIGVTLALGGRSGGGGDAVMGAVGIDDPFTPGVGFFQTVFPTATGVANRSDGRFGDYFTVHPHVACRAWFAATNYAWDSSPVDAANDVNSRYVEFGREKNLQCYLNGGGQ